MRAQSNGLLTAAIAVLALSFTVLLLIGTTPQRAVPVLIAIGALFSAWILARALIEHRARVGAGDVARDRLNWGAAIVILPFTVTMVALAHWWPTAQIPFVAIYFGTIMVGLILSLLVSVWRERRQKGHER